MPSSHAKLESSNPLTSDEVRGHVTSIYSFVRLPINRVRHGLVRINLIYSMSPL
jgi:hypothetical protein